MPNDLHLQHATHVYAYLDMLASRVNALIDANANASLIEAASDIYESAFERAFPDPRAS